MKTLDRNKKKIFYALFASTVSYIDEYGNETGSPSVTYGTPVELKANISPRQGESDTGAFGIVTDYSMVMVVDDTDCPIDESSVLWLTASVSAPHDAVVKAVSRSLNSIRYAIKEL